MYLDLDDKEYREFMKYLKHEALTNNDPMLAEEYNRMINERPIVIDRNYFIYKLVAAVGTIMWIIESIF